jgi:predicted membrane metal-binding protein
VLRIKKYIIIFIIAILISVIYTSIRNSKYQEYVDKMNNSTNFVGIIVSNETQNEYNTQYLLKITKIENEAANLNIYIRIKGDVILKYGDEIVFEGEYNEPDFARNDKGFNYKKYLKSIRNRWNNYNKRS